MNDHRRGRRSITAIAILTAVPWFVSGAFSAASAATAKPRVASTAVVRPALEPVNLHAFAPTVGGEVSWVEPNKKLRLKNAWHEIIFEADRREITVDGVRVFLGEAPTVGNGSMLVSPVDRDRVLYPLLSPRKFGPRPPIHTIVLDAGHGGKDKGTQSEALKLFEKDVALDVTQRLQHQLESRGYHVVLTRHDDTFVDLSERPVVAAKAGADLFLAIHFNAGPASVTGIETYRLTPQYLRSTASEKLTPDDNDAVPGNRWDPWNTLLGFSIHRQLHRDVGRFDRGLKHARFVVIRDLDVCPGVLIECGYLSNPEEAKLIALPAHREQHAAAIAAGVDAYAALFNAPEATASTAPKPAPQPASGGAIRAPRAKPGAPH